MMMMQLLSLLAMMAPLFSVAELKNELVLLGDENIGDEIKTVMKYKTAAELPVSWDYRPLGLLTTDLNQHIPVYW
jgi:hypothetical protein